ncbi:hypothetical protein GCM10017044_08470 [Kordiimonas sediminis]|uniref:Uncharacterized protein n=1 Tax=Kordiimonas sediminis TaxID=1735581 RepID=A0A919AM59_9PROT|nr:hypothetical protein [Kordiimonas sediminis]GHF16482.1 hypothetical protein GCM10017044_08470 [Kordiimonas sediminis]
MNTLIDIALASEATDHTVVQTGGLMAAFGDHRHTDSRVPDACRRARRENRRRRRLN